MKYHFKREPEIELGLWRPSWKIISVVGSRYRPKPLARLAIQLLQRELKSCQALSKHVYCFVQALTKPFKLSHHHIPWTHLTHDLCSVLLEHHSYLAKARHEVSARSWTFILFTRVKCWQHRQAIGKHNTYISRILSSYSQDQASRN